MAGNTIKDRSETSEPTQSSPKTRKFQPDKMGILPGRAPAKVIEKTTTSPVSSSSLAPSARQGGHVNGREKAIDDACALICANYEVPTSRRDALKSFMAKSAEIFADPAELLPCPPVKQDVPFPVRLQRMLRKDREAALAEHYKDRETWERARKADSSPAGFLKWLDANFPDRRELEFDRGDLDRLDHLAFVRLKIWRRSPDKATQKAVSQFGIAGKQGVFDPASAPTAREAFAAMRAGDPDALAIQRAANRARRYLIP